MKKRDLEAIGSYATATDAFYGNCVSTRTDNIPVGAAVYNKGTGSAGHVGIYIGGGKVKDSLNSGLKVHNSIEEWLKSSAGSRGSDPDAWRGWGWQGGVSSKKIPPEYTKESTIDKNEQTNANKDEEDDDGTEEETKREVGITTETGDGYTQIYTAQSGATYKLYKQGRGSYANNPYWDNTITTSGCGPSSISILASALTEYNYTPGDIASQMPSGMTSSDTLTKEMNSLGMKIEKMIENPSGTQITDYLNQGKVMLVSVNNGTNFTGGRHIMAILDINAEGKIFIGNPSNSQPDGWYDVSEITRGCNYILVTDGTPYGGKKTTTKKEGASYTAVIATSQTVQTTLRSDDDTNVSEEDRTTTLEKILTPTKVNYEEMVQQYAMPFDYLWALMTVSKDKNFVFDLVDLIYDSEIEITVFDNEVTTRNVDTYHYTKRTKSVVNGTMEVYGATEYVDGENKPIQKTLENHVDEVDEELATTKETITTTHGADIELTRANVWVVDYNKKIDEGKEEESKETNKADIEDQEYPEKPEKSERNFSYSCEHIDKMEDELKEEAQKHSMFGPTAGIKKDFTLDEYVKYISIYDDIETTVNSKNYVDGRPDMKEKTDEDTAPNFVTIFNSARCEKAQQNIRNVSSWLFEILEKNDSTKDMVDLTKYLLYKATGDPDYGVTAFDFSTFFTSNLTPLGNVEAGNFVVHTEDRASKDLVITDVDTLKRAFAGSKGAGSSNLVQYADDFLKYQEQYKVNAVFAAAVTINECGAGTNCQIGGNNWFSIKGDGGWRKYDSPSGSIEDFYKLIAQGSYYFKDRKYTVKDIGMVYCENADTPGGWIESVTKYMTNMFNAAGIQIPDGSAGASGTNSINATGKRKIIVDEAYKKIGCPYVYATAGPKTFDCSGLTSWCYAKAGIKISRSSGAQKNEGKKTSVRNAKPGDILWKPGHVAIALGNNEYIHAPQPGRTVEHRNDAAVRFTFAIRVIND